ncbi:TBCC-domain-containing protein [Auricularia subglabra TFB-10046 SS5]|nr:TBCC-domain-containing protein [Auricularia subglabra TFB-10046 SS5]
MSASTSQLIAVFYTQFKEEHIRLTDALKSPKPDVAALQLDAARLRKKLVDATEYLPAYDQRQYQSQLNTLDAELQAKRSTVAPKARFGFKRSAAPVTKSAAAPTPAPVAAPPPVAVSQANVLKVHDATDKYIDASSLASASGELTLSSLSGCIVDLRSGVDIVSVHANGLRRTVLLLPQIQGSILLDDCKECVIVVACHQFRMHTTTDSDVYLHIGSMPVIEHCAHVRFAHYPFDGLAPNASQHFAVQDFDWILPGQSPNWTRLPDGEAIAKERWPSARIDDPAKLKAVLDGLLPAQSK